MAGLTGLTIAATYNSLLRTLADGGITTSLQVIEDGAGDDTCLQLSTKQFLVKSGTDIDATFDVQNSSGHQLLTIDTASNPEEVVINEGGLTTVDFRVEGSSAANAFFVDGTNGNVGIGTASPDYNLEVSGDSDDVRIAISAYSDSANQNAQLLLRTADGTEGSEALIDDNDVVGQIRFQGYTNAFKDGAIIEAKAAATPGSGDDMPCDLNFYTANNGAVADVTATPQMTILKTGFVGIGSAAPSQLFEVSNSTGAVMSLRRSDTTIDGSGGGVGIGSIYWSGDDPSGTTQVCASIDVAANGEWGSTGDTTDAPCYMRFFTCPEGGVKTEAMRIDNNGWIAMGSGTLVPTARLHVDQASASGAVPVLRLDQGDTDESFIDFKGTSAADGSTHISSDTTTDSAKFGAVRIEINGVHKWIRVYDTHS